VTTYDPPSPTRLLAVVQDEPNDLEQHYAHITDLAWRTLRRLGVPPDCVPDAVQDTLLVVYRRQAEFRGDSSLETWVYGIVLRVASGYRRKGRRAGAVFSTPADGLVERTASVEPNPLDRLERSAATRLLHTLLDELRPEVREVFVLVELEELQLAEAARALGLSQSTCKGRLRIGRKLFNAAVARTRARLSAAPGIAGGSSPDKEGVV
jgi:RNA polymerase sigma-70 factor (ECF subfamily)